eukprot:4673115-Alexandrium_andersonii.AAC.1
MVWAGAPVPSVPAPAAVETQCWPIAPLAVVAAELQWPQADAEASSPPGDWVGSPRLHLPMVMSLTQSLSGLSLIHISEPTRLALI